MDFNKFSSSSMFSSDDFYPSTERETGLWEFGESSKNHDGNEVTIITDPRETSLYSSSLSDLFSRKLRLSADNAFYRRSLDTNASHYHEEQLAKSLKELEAEIIRNLLPDEDDLLSGVTDDWNNHIVPDSTGDDIDELDIFSSVGGFELEDVDNSSSGEKNSKIIGRANTSIAAENPSGVHSSRTLLVRNIDRNVKDNLLKSLFEQFGFITFYRACKHQGLAMISYYDIKSSQNAMRALHNTLFGRKKFEIHYSIPSQSTNSESNVTQQIRPESILECNLCLHQNSPPTTSFQGLYGISSSVPKMLPSAFKFKSVGNQCDFTESSSPWQLNLDALAFHPHSLPEHRYGFTNDVPFNPLEEAGNIYLETNERIDNMQFFQVNSNGPFMDFDECGSTSTGHVSSSFPLSGHHENWSNSYPPPQTMWPSSPTQQGFNHFPMSPSYNHHVQSPPLWDRRNIVPPNMPPHSGHNFHNQRSMMFDGYKSLRSRRNVGTSNMVELKQFELDIDCIKRGEDNRTTLMIKNILNKYTSAKLLETINERHGGTYDFLYLPIDFKNKCNVGYAFINMTSPSLIVPFYEDFNGKKWECFNSEKVAALAYARIQGKAALTAHFQHSSLMNMDELCKPKFIKTDGPNAGDC